MTKSSVNRRAFLAGTAAAGAAMTLPAVSYARVPGANEKVRIGFLGTGGRCQQHIDVITDMRDDGKPVDPFAVCDVWDGDFKLGKRNNDKKGRTGRGLYPSAKTCGIPDSAGKDRISKDYRTILDNKDVDVVCIATPDHWHARMAIDAMERGKDVYLEKPMTKTIAEAILVVDTAAKLRPDGHGRRAEHGRPDLARRLRLHQGRQHRPRPSGSDQLLPQLRRRSVALLSRSRKEMTPQDHRLGMWLGCDFEICGQKLGPTPEEMPFDRAVWAQWRCYWPFGGGMFTDLFVHQTTHLISAMGVRFPARVVGGGGLYMEYDGRDVPDVATVVADYNEGCQVIISATMCNDTQLGEIIRGHLGTIKFIGSGDYIKGYEVYAQYFSGGPSKPKEQEDKPIAHVREPEKSGNATVRPVGELPRARPHDRQGKAAADAQHPGTRRRGVLDREHGRAELSLRQGAVLGQGEADAAGSRCVVGVAVGSPQQEARHAEPDHRLERRRQGQHAHAGQVPEPGRPVDRRQGSGGIVAVTTLRIGSRAQCPASSSGVARVSSHLSSSTRLVSSSP